MGAGASEAFSFRSAYSISYKIDFKKASLLPGIEAYLRPNDNSYQVGPVLYGEIRTDAGNELEYSLGVVHGINPGAPDKTLVARLEYEFF